MPTIVGKAMLACRMVDAAAQASGEFCFQSIPVPVSA
jgi:hypothetical protein